MIGLDIGGANIKVASVNEEGIPHGRSLAFPLWQRQNELTQVLCSVLADLEGRGVEGAVVATMTGELADCFTSRQDGVAFIVDNLSTACQHQDLPAPVFYQLTGELVDREQAKSDWQLTAASNWNAIAAWVAADRQGRFQHQGSGLLVDLGSTTCDIVPFERRQILDPLADDFQRLTDQRLVYVGMVRTPVCSLIQEVLWNGQSIPLARELFATLLDCCLVSGWVPESADSKHTADGRPATCQAAFRRLAKMVCLDEDANEDLVHSLARQTIEEARKRVLDAICYNRLKISTGGPLHLLIGGEGAALVHSWFQESDEVVVERLDEVLSADICSSLGAYAVLELALAGTK